ncbi:hypothetical protein [Cellulomonas oligotrophica]|nr:hypothetical protein [Cellulomonas oligotrophica]NYD87804.1 transcriptional regulator with XRE-family HTH domain [Cellulomonas oligotrophica]
MARTGKPLRPLDRAVVEVLVDKLDSTGLSRRKLAEITGMSTNRIGIILRAEEPPPTIGELSALAGAAGVEASEVLAAAERGLERDRPRIYRLPAAVADAAYEELPDAADDAPDWQREDEEREQY